jgi:hypothetical protein
MHDCFLINITDGFHYGSVASAQAVVHQQMPHDTNLPPTVSGFSLLCKKKAIIARRHQAKNNKEIIRD